MLLRLWALMALLGAAKALDTSIYSTCDDVNFCSYFRNNQPDPNQKVTVKQLSHGSESVEIVFAREEQDDLVLTINAVLHNIFQVNFEEVNSTRQHLHHILSDVYGFPMRYEKDDESIHVIFGDSNRLVVYFEGPKIEVYKYEELVFVLNGESLTLIFNEGDNQSFAFDAFFPGAKRAYGLPEHADSLTLRDTKAGDPYRLYALDAPGFELNSTMALYGHVPLLYAHSKYQTTGLFLLNAAEQWVDIDYRDEGIMAHFMVDTGAFEFFVLPGPTPLNVYKQYIYLTGEQPVPPLWALGYHQCRYSYESQEDVKEVVANFDRYDFPLDVIWGDVGTQDGHRYFTWDPETFSDPIEMLNNVSSTQRRFITVVDPHFKKDDDYFVYAEGVANDYFVKTADGEVYIGDTWPGDAAYLDFFNPEAVEYYKSLFAYDVFESNPTLAGFWNDMNEPSVFDDDHEWTFPRSNLMYGNVENREIHSLYGYMHTKATYEALLQRDDSAVRPFILSRSFFAGSQKNGIAVWNGDSYATFDYLAYSYKMCLGIGLGGIPFCGADVGGFFGDPDEELLVRWYQAAAWLPFFRAHASIETQRREPYLFGEDTQRRIRNALRTRYAHLPVWYTLFHDHFRMWTPVVRPMFFHYEMEEDVYDIDDQLMVGPDILVKGVFEAGVSQVRVFLPGGSEVLWYDVEATLMYPGRGYYTVPVDLEGIPVFYKSGSVTVRKDNPTSSTAAMLQDGYNVYIFLDYSDFAYSYIYLDSFDGFGYKQQERVYLYIGYRSESVIISANQGTLQEDQFRVASYVIYRPPSVRSSSGPVKPERIVVTKTADGTDLKDIKLNRNETIIRLSMP